MYVRDGAIEFSEKKKHFTFLGPSIFFLFTKGGEDLEKGGRIVPKREEVVRVKKKKGGGRGKRQNILAKFKVEKSWGVGKKGSKIS